MSIFRCLSKGGKNILNQHCRLPEPVLELLLWCLVFHPAGGAVEHFQRQHRRNLKHNFVVILNINWCPFLLQNRIKAQWNVSLSTKLDFEEAAIKENVFCAATQDEVFWAAVVSDQPVSCRANINMESNMLSCLWSLALQIPDANVRLCISIKVVRSVVPESLELKAIWQLTEQLKKGGFVQKAIDILS